MAKKMIELEKYFGGIVACSDGIWRSNANSAISYPSDGNSFCAEIEDSSFWFNHRNRCIVSMIQSLPPPQSLFFDIGGGNGFVAGAIRTAGYQVVLIEPGRGVLNAQTRSLDNIVQSTFQDLRTKPGTLPAVGMFDVLEHIDDDMGTLTMLHEALVPGGRLYLTVPAHSWLWSNEDDRSGHVRRYTRVGLGENLTTAGFDISYLSYYFSALVWPIFLLRSLPYRIGIKRSRHSSATDHSRQPKTAGKLIVSLLAGEVNRISARNSMRLGASLLAVATKR